MKKCDHYCEDLTIFNIEDNSMDIYESDTDTTADGNYDAVQALIDQDIIVMWQNGNIIEE